MGVHDRCYDEQTAAGAEIIQLERALSKLVRAAEFHLEGHDRSRENLQDAIATAKDYLS